jgi:TRAP-type C4-dicarboxylate transport system permease small subunit
MTRREALLFRAFAVWTIYVWVTRMWNIARDHTPGHGLGFKLVHAVLAVISVAFALAALSAVARIRKRHATSEDIRA